MDIHMEESKIENSNDHQVSPSLDPSTNETSSGISRDGSNSNTIIPNEPVANYNSEPPLGEIPKINWNFGNYYIHIFSINCFYRKITKNTPLHRMDQKISLHFNTYVVCIKSWFDLYSYWIFYESIFFQNYQ